MVQFARPISDLDNTGVWTTTPLWSDIDEGGGGDGTVVVSDTTPVVTEPFTVDLSTIIDPTLPTGHILRIRWAKNSGGAGNQTIRIELRQGYVSEASQGTLIATDDYSINSTTLRTDATTLSAGEANSITDYTDLQIRVMGVSSNRALKVDFVELETPSLVAVPPTRMAFNSRTGPFKRSADDNLYYVSVRNNASFFDQITVWRSSDDGFIWSAIDDLDPVNGDSTSTSNSIATVQDGDTLHIVWGPFETSYRLAYATYNMATETPGTPEEIASGVSFTGLAIDIRSDGDLVIGCADGGGNTSLWRGTAGSWTKHADIFAASAGYEGIVLSVAPNDDTHFFWHGTGSGSAGVYHRVLREDYTLSTEDQITSTGGFDDQDVSQSAIFLGKLHVMQAESDGDVVAWSADIGETPTWSSDVLGADNDFVAGSWLGLWSAGGRMAAVWVRGSDQDIRYALYESGWGSEQSASDTTPDGVDTWRDWRAFVRGGTVYMAGFTKINSSQNTRYHEFSLGVVVVNADGTGYAAASGTVAATIIEADITAEGHVVAYGTVAASVAGVVQGSARGYAVAAGLAVTTLRQEAVVAGHATPRATATGDSIGPVDATASGHAVPSAKASGSVPSADLFVGWGIPAAVN